MAKTLSIIVAIAEDYGIGNKNDLLAYISSDLKRFKALTTGNTILMGRNTWESLPKKPLPNRQNIVLTSNKNLQLTGADVVCSVEEALLVCPENKESFVIGGASIYKQFFDVADKLYITKIRKTFEADTFFPEIDSEKWKVESESEVFVDEKTGLEFQYINYIKA